MTFVAYLSLLIGIALPWVAGFNLLRLRPVRQAGPGELARCIGYGFFLGILLLTLVLRVMDAWFGTVSLLGVNGLFAAIGFIAWWAGRAGPPDYSFVVTMRKELDQSPWKLAVLALLAGWALMHLVFSLFEIITLPLFPWDGWTVWAYRAKVWFLTGGFIEFVSAYEWMNSTNSELYTITAKTYPLLPSLVHFWAALSLGGWHEALINLPVFFCGFSIALALWGRVQGTLNSTALVLPMLAAYLLVSTPMFGIHMSLGGYADIWLAGFAGLGMVAVLSGLIREDNRTLILGIVFLFAGMTVKVEGLLWLSMGLAMIVLISLPVRVLLIALICLISLGTLAWLSGITALTIPGLGRVGYVNGFLAIPFKGLIKLRVFDVTDAYWRNAFVLGSWHLVWVMFAAALLALFASPMAKLARTCGTFFLLFAGLQIMIFVFTTEGAWARDYTAINRLPLQMLPAILFLLVVAMGQLVRHRGEQIKRVLGQPKAWLTAAGATGLGLCLCLIWLAQQQPEDPTEPFSLGQGSLRFMVGEGDINSDGIQVDGYQDGIALLSTGPVTISASDYPLLQVSLDLHATIDDPAKLPAFFWRRSNQTTTVSRITLDKSRVIDLTVSPDWRGQIVEAGFLFIDNGPGPNRLLDAELQDNSFIAALRLTPGEWGEFEPWVQRSANWIAGGAPKQRLPLMPWVICLVFFVAIVTWFILGRREFRGILVLCLLAGWLMLDVRWTWDRMRQFDKSIAQLTELTVDERMTSSELGRDYPFLSTLLTDYLGDEPKRIALVQDPFGHKYFPLRAKYQLLPHSVSVLLEPPRPASIANVDYVLFLGDFLRGQQTINDNENAQQQLRRFGVRRWNVRQSLDLVYSSPQGALYKVVPREKSAQSSP